MHKAINGLVTIVEGEMGRDPFSVDLYCRAPGKRAEIQSYLWVQRGGPPDHPILLYDYDPSRSQKVPIRLFESFSGYLLTDGDEAYSKVCGKYALTAVGCGAHVRRKFDELFETAKANDSEDSAQTS